MGSRIFRAKGFVRLTEEPARRYLLQQVGRRWTLEERGGGASGSRRRDRLHRARLIDSREDPAASGTTAGTDSDKLPFWFLSRFLDS